MRKSLLLAALFCMWVCTNVTAQILKLEHLVEEIVDRDKITRFPNYQSKQTTSYNRESVSPDLAGWFADSDGVDCVRKEVNNGREEWVLMEDEGAGVIAKFWAVCFYFGLDNTVGGNVRFYIDGAEEPVIEENLFKLVKGESFVKAPFADESKRAGNLYLPIPYAKSCKITLDKPAFYYIINYRSYPKGTKVESFSMDVYKRAQKKIEAVGQVLTTKESNTKGNKELNYKLKKGESTRIQLPQGAHALSNLSLRLKSKNQAQALRSTILKCNFDSEETVWAPVGDFFNNGVGKKAYTMWEREVTEQGEMICHWRMPYKNSGEVCFENLAEEEVEISVSYQVEKYKWDDRSMHFHATWRMDEPTPTFPLFDYNLLTVEGSGVIVGDQFTVLNPAEGWWGEGDEKIYIDDDHARKFPSHFGTGTEDYYGWAGGVFPNPVDEFSKPFIANVLVGSPNAMGYNICSRTRVMDAIPFKDKITFDIESSCGTRTSWFHLQYATMVYWYAKPMSKFNRKPLYEMAAAKIMNTAELQAYNEKAKGNMFVVDGALEAENLKTYKISDKVEEITIKEVWGEISSGKLQSYKFSGVDETVTVRITEQFEPMNIEFCAVLAPSMGEVDIYVNNKFVKTQSLNTGHSSLSTPYIDLGKHNPIDNYFEVKFVSKIKEATLGIDFFYLTKPE